MAREQSIVRLQREWGAKWLEVMRDKMNTAPTKQSNVPAAAAVVGVDSGILRNIITDQNINGQIVYLLPGDELVIRRGGVETVVSDRRAETK